MTDVRRGPLSRRRAWTVVLAAGALVASTVIPAQTAGAAPAAVPQLLSYGKPATASSFQNEAGCSGCSADKAVDGDLGTRWATSSVTGWVDPGWLEVDLGAEASISEVVIDWEAAYATAYQIQVSDDPGAAGWTDVYSTTTAKGHHEDLTVSGEGRYVRLNLTKRNGNPYGYSLFEFRVYGTGGDPTPPPNQAPDPDFSHLQLVFDEEFDDPAGTTPDPTKWVAETGGTGWGNNELEYYTDNQNVATDGDGNLVIQARKENVGGRGYTSARLNSLFSFQYGRVEARLKVPDGAGYWPAFWMMGTNIHSGVGWPYNGEVDFTEILGKDTTVDYATIHGPSYNTGDTNVGLRYSPEGAPKLSDDFHVFTTDWDSTGFRYYLDGRLFYTVSKATVQANNGPWVYDHPFYLLLNLAVGGNFAGPVGADTVFPGELSVDYIRIFQSPTTPPAGDGTETVTTTIPQAPGEFAWTIEGADHAVDLGAAINHGAYWQATGDLKPVSVSDTRAGRPAWSISGQVGDFTGGLDGRYLGWSPTVVTAGAGATAGPAVDSGFVSGNGLKDSSVLGSASAGHATGTGSIGAGLDLRVPATTDAGTYSTTLTLTALS